MNKLLKDLEVGERFCYSDKFPDGYVRETNGEVIGQTSRDYTAYEWDYRIHYKKGGDEKDIKFVHDDGTKRYSLMDSRVTVLVLK